MDSCAQSVSAVCTHRRDESRPRASAHRQRTLNRQLQWDPERQRPQVSSLLVTYLVYLYMHIQRTYSASCSTQSRHSTRQTRVEYCNSTLSTCRPYLRLDTSDSTPRGATHDTGRGPEGTRPHDEIKVTLTAALASKLGREFLLVTRLCTLHSLLSDRLAVYCRRVLDRRAS
jgi:hypothetical protein